MAGKLKKGTAAAANLFRMIFRSPTRIPIFGFAALILIGTLLLMIPAATTIGAIKPVDALFTAVSASCVTGLVVVDTGRAFSTFGKIVILVLIQVGGLGIMTMSTLFILLGGRRLSLTERVVIQDTFTIGGDRSVAFLIRHVVVFALILEAIGTVLLFPRFMTGKSAEEALFFALFHAVSAFCNAGFSFFTQSFSAYREDWLFNLVISFLVITGGIGFVVLSELKQHFPFNRRTWSRLSLHAKLVLSVTLLLLTSGTLLVTLMEWNNTLAPLSVPDRLLAGFFQSVSTRTAGFNTLPIGQMANTTLFVFMLLMFIGASPGSCGGGIKTTTFASLIVLGFSRLRGRRQPQVFQRTISAGSIGRAMSVVLISFMMIGVATMVILMTELGETPHPESRGKFLELFFEVVSAFGTVGLSTGATPGLSTIGKLILSVVMFVGRLGPLVVAMAVSRRTAPRYYYAEEAIMSG